MVRSSLFFGSEFGLNPPGSKILGGSYVYEFPSMVGVSLHSANAAIIVFALDDQETFEEARRLRLVRWELGRSCAMKEIKAISEIKIRFVITLDVIKCLKEIK